MNNFCITILAILTIGGITSIFTKDREPFVMSAQLVAVIGFGYLIYLLN